MEKIEKLTPEQEAKIDVYRDMYLAKFFNNPKEAELEEVTEYIHWFYETFDVSPNKKPIVVLCDSPYECLVEINKVENNGVFNKENFKWYAYSSSLSAFNSWVSFCDFFDKEVVKLDDSELFNKYKKILDLNIFWSNAFENYVFVSKNAIRFNRDTQNNLHSISEKAIEFKDGYGFYFIHGVNIVDSLWEKLQADTYTFEDFVKETNEEVKNAVITFFMEKYGNEYVFRFLSENLKEVDTYVDKKSEQYLKGTTMGMNVGVYTLFKGQMGNTELAFVRCYCPSTDRMFFLGVDPETNDNAKDAIASLYRVPEKLKKHIKYIQRQGERFTTVFDEKGNQLMKTLPKEDLTNLVPVSGDEYFELMTYEY